MISKVGCGSLSLTECSWTANTHPGEASPGDQTLLSSLKERRFGLSRLRRGEEHPKTEYQNSIRVRQKCEKFPIIKLCFDLQQRSWKNHGRETET